MLCDTCDAAWHIFCLDPPLDAVPEGHWQCPDCTAKRTAAAIEEEEVEVVEVVAAEKKPRLSRLKQGAGSSAGGAKAAARGGSKAAGRGGGRGVGGRGAAAAAAAAERKVQLALAAARRRLEKAREGLSAAQMAVDALSAPKGQRRVGGNETLRLERTEREAAKGVMSTHGHK